MFAFCMHWLREQICSGQMQVVDLTVLTFSLLIKGRPQASGTGIVLKQLDGIRTLLRNKTYAMGRELVGTVPRKRGNK
jgi:hypothetical protein